MVNADPSTNYHNECSMQNQSCPLTASRILLEAEQLFWKYGIRSATMDGIARRLGISKKTIYQYFSDKEDILYQVVLARTEQDEADIRSKINQAGNPLEEIIALLNLMWAHANRVNPTLLLDIRRHYPKAFDVYRQHKETYLLRLIQENIQKGAAQGLYRADLHADVLARMWVEQIEWAVDSTIYPVDKYPMFEIQRELMHHFVRGMLTEPGLSVYNQLASKSNEDNLTVYERK